MPRDMFGDVVDPSIKVGTKQWYTVPLSILTHTVVLFALVVIPLLATDMIPTPQSVMAFVAMPPPPPAPPPPPPPPAPPPSVVKPVEMPNPNAAPIEAPKDIKPEPPPPPSAASMTTGVVGGVPGGVPGGQVGGVVGGIAPPPPPPPPPQQVRVGGDIKEPKKVRNIDPIYPAIAQQAKIQGYVIIEAVIGKDGRIKDAKVLGGQQMLQEAALAAVKQWQYTPTLLNGVPVEVIMNVTVHFKLN